MVRRSATSQVVDVLAHPFAIPAHHHVGKHGHLLLRLRVFEQQDRIVEIEIQLVLIEHMKRDEVVSFETQMLKRFLQPLRLIVKVGDDDDDAATRQDFGELMQRFRARSVSPPASSIERLPKIVRM